MNIQDIIKDSRQYRENFIKTPIKEIIKDRFFYWMLAHSLFTLCMLVFIQEYIPSNTPEHFTASLSILLFQSLFLAMAIRISERLDTIKARKINKLSEDLVPSTYNSSVELTNHKIIWLTERYNCDQQSLKNISKQIISEWNEWLTLDKLSSKDELTLAKSYFSFPKGDRLMISVTAILAIIASIVITLGADKDSFYPSLGTIWSIFISLITTYGLVIIVFVTSLILPASVLWASLKMIAIKIEENASEYNISNHSLFSYAKDLRWLAGFTPSHPEDKSLTLRMTDKIIRFIYTPIDESYLHTKKRYLIPFHAAIALTSIYWCVGIYNFLIQ